MTRTRRKVTWTNSNYYNEYNMIMPRRLCECTYCFRGLEPYQMSWKVVRTILSKENRFITMLFFYYIKWMIEKNYYCNNDYALFFEHNKELFNIKKEKSKVDLKCLTQYDSLDDIYVRRIGLIGAKVFYLPYKNKALLSAILEFLESINNIKSNLDIMINRLDEGLSYSSSDLTKIAINDYLKLIKFYTNNNIPFQQPIILKFLTFCKSKDFIGKYRTLCYAKYLPTDIYNYDFYNSSSKFDLIPEKDKIYLIDDFMDVRKYSSSQLEARTLNFTLVNNLFMREYVKKYLLSIETIGIVSKRLTNALTYIAFFINQCSNYISLDDFKRVSNTFETRTQKRGLYEAKRFCIYLSKYNLADKEIKDLILYKKREKPKARPKHSTQQIVTFIKLLRDSNYAYSDITFYLLAIINFTSIRIGSLLNLTLSDIKAESGNYYLIVNTKTNHNFVEYPITKKVYDLLIECIKYTSSYRKDAEPMIKDFVFIAKVKTRIKLLNSSNICDLFKKINEKYRIHITTTDIRKRTITNNNDLIRLFGESETPNNLLDNFHTPNSLSVVYNYTVASEFDEIKHFKNIIGNVDKEGNLIINATNYEELPPIQDCLLCPDFIPNENGCSKIKKLNAELKCIRSKCKDDFENKCIDTMITALTRKENEYEK